MAEMIEIPNKHIHDKRPDPWVGEAAKNRSGERFFYGENSYGEQIVVAISLAPNFHLRLSHGDANWKTWEAHSVQELADAMDRDYAPFALCRGERMWVLGCAAMAQRKA